MGGAGALLPNQVGGAGQRHLGEGRRLRHLDGDIGQLEIFELERSKFKSRLKLVRWVNRVIRSPALEVQGGRQRVPLSKAPTKGRRPGRYGGCACLPRTLHIQDLPLLSLGIIA